MSGFECTHLPIHRVVHDGVEFCSACHHTMVLYKGEKYGYPREGVEMFDANLAAARGIKPESVSTTYACCGELYGKRHKTDCPNGQAAIGAVRIDDPIHRSIDDASGEEWNAASRRVRLDAEQPKQGTPIPAGYGAVKSMYSAPNGDVFVICDYGVLRVDGDRLVGLAP